VQVVPDEAALQSKVVELAMSFRSKVPVVIICGAQTERCSALSKTLKGKSSSLGDKAVLEITGYGLDKAKIKEFVELATKPLTDTTTAKQAWPVTVTDYEGGAYTALFLSLQRQPSKLSPSHSLVCLLFPPFF
jgi:hypothetical protein